MPANTTADAEPYQTGRRAVPLVRAVPDFVAWLRDHGDDFAGHWWPCEDITEFWRWYCAEAGIEEHAATDANHQLSKQPGVLCERRRLKGSPQLAGLRRYLARLTSRTVPVKAVVYRIATVAEMALEPAPVHRLGEAAPPVKRNGSSAASHQRPQPRKQQMPLPLALPPVDRGDQARRAA